MTGLLLTIFSGFIGYTGEDIAQKVQEQYIVERYFEWIEEQEPLVWRSGRVLGQKVVGIKGGNLTNRTDCGGLIVGYMIYLDLIKTRWKDVEGYTFTYDGGGLNSFRLYTLGETKPRSEVKRGDFVYLEFEGGVRHIAISCNSGATEIYDLYKKPQAECRIMPKYNKLLFSSNGVVKFLNDRGIILEDTKKILYELQKFDHETNLENIINYLSYGIFNNNILYDIGIPGNNYM